MSLTDPEFRISKTPTCKISIFVSGNKKIIESVCSRECDYHNICVSVSKNKYIYDGGIQSGVEIVLINYPRFPKEKTHLEEIAISLAESIIKDTHQKSATIVSDKETIWVYKKSHF